MFFYQKTLIVLIISFMAAALSGCGEKAVKASSTTRLEASGTCIECHESVRSPVTGNLIVEEWKLSSHNLNNLAGCADCHEPDAGHPTSCNLCHGGTPTAIDVTHNPDASGKCAKCHTSKAGYNTAAAMRLHFANTSYPVTFGTYTASFVSTNYVRNCRKCHNPHNPTSNIEYNRSWANSGHGLTTSLARVNGDFKLYGTNLSAEYAYTNSQQSPSTTTDPAIIANSTPVCVRCHTTTGYTNFVNSGFMTLKPFGSNTDKTKEVTGCDACHTDYSFKVRPVPRVTIYYNFSGATVVSVNNPGGHEKIQRNAVMFPDLGSSNLCVPCHSGRGIGSEIDLLRDNIQVDFVKSGNPSVHNYNEAAILTVKSSLVVGTGQRAHVGYEFKDGVKPNLDYITGNGANTGHDSFGMSSGKGPCIACHMNKSVPSDSHTFKPVVHGSKFQEVFSVNAVNVPLGVLTIASVTSQSCNTSGCHVNITAAELTSDKEGYLSALAALNKWVRLVRNVPNNPQSTYNAATNTARLTTKWDYLGVGTGSDLMGAAFNLSMFNVEPGAYVHNPLYAKRLIYDSIYFLCTNFTNPVLGSNQYPTVQQFNVADAINFLTTATVPSVRTLETVNGVPNVEVAATITQNQADAAIKWLYGSSSPTDKYKRPGD
jgi:hypothetical protein